MRALVLVLAAACSPIHYTMSVPNLAQVDENIWRSGQITTEEGWDTIAKLAHGRRVNVIKLNFDKEGLDDIAESRGFTVVYLPIQPEGDQDVWDDVRSTFTEPDPLSVEFAEMILEEAHRTTRTDIYLVHCTHGQDRTGIVIGEHRVLHDGWSKDGAYKEMREHNFHWELRGLKQAWDRFFP